MKRALTITLLAVITLIAAAQPQLTWLERKHDFGVILEENGKVHCSMRLVNTGDEPLLIIKAQAGCGCTGINYTQAPIQPGDTATVDISYNPSGRPGEFSKDVVIHTNTVPKRTTLVISGNVIPSSATLDKQYPLRAGPLCISQQMLPFGEVKKGKNRLEYLSTYNSSTDTLVIKVRGAKPHINPAFIPDTLPPAHVAALTVQYKADRAPLWGLNEDTLTLECLPLGAKPDDTLGTADVLVIAQVVETFDHLTDKQRQEAPVVAVDCGDRLDFGTVAKGETVTRTFTVTNKGKDNLIIRRLWVPEDTGITISSDKKEIKRGKKATVTVTTDTSSIQDNLLNVPLTLMCNDPESPRTTIRLVGIID